MREAVARVGDAERLEISGGVTLENVGDYVEAGARRISDRAAHAFRAVASTLPRGDRGRMTETHSSTMAYDVWAAEVRRLARRRATR